MVEFLCPNHVQTLKLFHKINVLFKDIVNTNQFYVIIGFILPNNKTWHKLFKLLNKRR